MFAPLCSLSLLFTTASLLLPAKAFQTFSDSTVAYLTNCQTSDTQVFYSEVSIYNDVAQSFNGQNPDLYDDTPLGGTVTWEGTQLTWNYASNDPAQPDAFLEFIEGNAQDPAVPVNTNVGCATYTAGFTGGAIAFQFLCSKDTPRQLYATSDHECTTIYYCRINHGACPFTAPSQAPLVEQTEL